jgi:hypothetical protein
MILNSVNRWKQQQKLTTATPTATVNNPKRRNKKYPAASTTVPTPHNREAYVSNTEENTEIDITAASRDARNIPRLEECARRMGQRLPVHFVRLRGVII